MKINVSMFDCDLNVNNFKHHLIKIIQYSFLLIFTLLKKYDYTICIHHVFNISGEWLDQN